MLGNVVRVWGVNSISFLCSRGRTGTPWLSHPEKLTVGLYDKSDKVALPLGSVEAFVALVLDTYDRHRTGCSCRKKVHLGSRQSRPFHLSKSQ